jgi:membrane protein
VWRLLKGTVLKFIHDKGTFLAAGLAFNLLLYSVPFLLLIISTLAYTVGSSDQALAQVQENAKQLLPHSSEAFANILTTIIAHRNVLGLVAVPLFLLLSSWLFGAIRLALNVIFEAPPKRSYLKAKLRDLVMIFIVTCLVIMAVGLTWVLAVLHAFSAQIAVVQTLFKPGWMIATQAVVILFTFALFYTLYRFSSGQTISRPALWVSSITGAGLFSLSKWGFSWYVALAKANTLIYGALAGLIFFFLWLYYASLVFVIAAEIGWVFDREYRSFQRGPRR